MSDYTPRSGRMLGDDGQVYNVVDLLGGGTPVSDEVYDIEQYTPASGDVIGEDGQVYNLVDLLQSVAAGEGSVADGAVTTPKIADEAVTTPKIADGAVTPEKLAEESVEMIHLAQEVLSRIDAHKFTPLSGSSNDADQLTDTGIYFNIGGYGLQNAPRNNYGWMLIVSHGTSNGNPRGAQVYFDHDGFDWRGFDNSVFTPWQTCIVKNAVEGIDPIDDPSSATPEDIATAFNNLLAALKG